MALVPNPQVLTTDEMGRIAPPIMTSVGEDGVNAPGDVFVIQSLLNDRLPKPRTPLAVTGVMDPGTVLAIEAYQAVMMDMRPPTGIVKPGDATYYSLASRPLVNQAPPPVSRGGRVGQVPPDVVEAAVASRLKWSVPASVTMAQWVVESAWGASMPPGSNNPFGIKALPSQDAVESVTWEVVNGEKVTITARFRKFASLTEAFESHGRLLATARPYKAAMLLVADADAFADALTGVYATDPNYSVKLKWVINNYGFRQYDKQP